MYLKYVQIVNYKNLKSSIFTFDKGTNTIIGENDSGKSNAMTAMRILLDNTYFYNSKRLKESDFSNTLGDWRGHWIIISAFFDGITKNDKKNEICAEIIPQNEDVNFLKSHIRCRDENYGTITLFIRPVKKIREELYKSKTKKEFDEIRERVSLTDYEFFYTSRSQADFTNEDVYKKVVGDFETGQYSNPDEEDAQLLGSKIDIMSIWQHISLVFIDALRDVESELRRPRNPIRRIFDTVRNEIKSDSRTEITQKIQDLNNTISSIKQISNIGQKINNKLNEIVGLVYSPEINIESKLKEDIDTLSKYLSVLPSDHSDIELLGLGHLNILYIALKLVEFDYNRNHEILNIMIIEEPEAHIHTHIQKTLFDNLKVSNEYTQVIMTTHSTQLSEVSDITKVNVLKCDDNVTNVMNPSFGLDDFGKEKLKYRDLKLSQCLERYLDAKRSVLLFSKGVILVEGDGEEILLPALVKSVFGVSLDELGIGLINIGSVGFNNVAPIFSDERLKRYCAIITDLDALMEGSEKSSANAAKRGENRKEKLDKLFSNNKWVKTFYAPYTFEVDFASVKENRKYIKSIINKHYQKKETIEKHITNLEGKDIAKRYDSILTIAASIGKGWYSTLLASEIDCCAILPNYILEALVFASQEIIDIGILWKMFCFSLFSYTGEAFQEIKKEIECADNDERKVEIMNRFENECQEDMFSKFMKKRKELLND